jgi:D-aminopeptidase
LRVSDSHDLCNQLLVAALDFRGKLIRGQFNHCGQLVVGGFELGNLLVARGLNED